MLLILQDDVDIPSTKKPRHACQTCGKVFTRPDNLKRHEKMHMNDKQHRCSKCDKTFYRYSDMKRHEKQVHEKRAAQREYHCTICGETFHNLAPFQLTANTLLQPPNDQGKEIR